jgi:GT2 family glycosyltransferase
LTSCPTSGAGGYSRELTNQENRSYGCDAISKGTLLVVVVAYLSGETIAECLRSTIRFCPNAVVIVVDNSDDVATASAVEALSSETGVRILDRPQVNLGYARAVNRAERSAADTDFVLVLNPDVVLTADPLQLITCLDNADVAAGTLVSRPSDCPQRFPNARPRVSLTRELLRSGLGSRVYRGPARRSGIVVRVDQLDGAYLLARRSWFRAHPLDESFELYYEDVAFCDAARTERGCVISPEIVGVHTGGASADKSGGLAYLASRVSRARYLCRRYPRMPGLVLSVLFFIEAVSRTAMRRPEPVSLRLHALVLALREIKNPGSIGVLGATA